MTLDPAIFWVARIGLAGVFALALGHKLRDPVRFRATLADYQIVPAALVAPSAAGVAAAEFATLCALALPPLDPAGPLAAIALLGAYSLAIALNLARGRRDIDCGCLGPGRRQPLSAWLLARNGALAAAAAALVTPHALRALLWLDALTIAGGVIALTLLWNAANRLAAATSLARRLP
jgi:hypothetical protein